MELAMALVDKVVDIHAVDENQITPLHYACRNGNMELAMALVDRAPTCMSEINIKGRLCVAHVIKVTGSWPWLFWMGAQTFML